MFKKGGQIFLFLILLWSGFFYWHDSGLRADDETVVINEIAWMGNFESSSDEWIELKNLSDIDIDLEGWVLASLDNQPSIALHGIIPAQGYFLLERTDDTSAPLVTADLIYTGALGNNGEDLELRNENNDLVDIVQAASGWPAGDNASKQTMVRKEDGSWANSLEAGGSPNDINLFNKHIEEDEEEEQENMEDEDSEPAKETDEEPSVNTSPWQFIKWGEVVINEFCSDPDDNDVEWVEIYNTLGRVVDIDEWTIEEGSGAKTIISGQLGVVADERFALITKPKGHLNNSGDIIILRDKEGVMIDKVVYGDWGENDESNAPSAKDPASVARKFDGYNSNNNADDFDITDTPTPKSNNIITNANSADKDSEKNYDYSQDIIINEILPNPIGKDSEEEFIELFNQGEKTVDLNFWMLGDASSKKYLISDSSRPNGESLLIKPGEYKLFFRTETKIVLNNDYDSVMLYWPEDNKALQTLNYEKAPESESFNAVQGRGRKLSYEWSTKITPGTENIIMQKNILPIIDFYCPAKVLLAEPFICDASDSVDENGDELVYSWDFGDGFTSSLELAEHTYFKIGIYDIKLQISDSYGESTEKQIINVVSKEKVSTQTKSNDENIQESAEEITGIIINEFIPNPVGADKTGEWIELYNTNNKEINLKNWQIDDEESGSRPYIFVADTWIDALGFLLVERVQSKIALNNMADEVRLFNGNEEMVDKIAYGKSYEGQSYARDVNNNWHWTLSPTPATKNKFSLKQSAKNDKIDKIVNKSDYLAVEPDEVFLMEVGDKIICSGTVAVKPGVLGSQFFYIDSASSSGLQIYSYKKDFPVLERGMLISVQGELSQAGGEWRLKISSSSNISIISSGRKVMASTEKCVNIDSSKVGQLIKIVGEAVEIKNTSFVIDDETGEIEVYLKNSVDPVSSKYMSGDKLAVVGIVRQTKSGIRLWPRDSDDIEMIQSSTASTNDAGGKVLGVIEKSNVWILPPRNRRTEIFRLVLLGSVILIAVISVFYIRFRIRA